MTWSKHKLSVPSGFTDFTWKKNRFVTEDAADNFDISYFCLKDRKTENKWLLNMHVDNYGSLVNTLNNLYERNGYLRRECSKQTFLANDFKKKFDDYVLLIRKKNDIIQKNNFLYETVDEIISYKELPNILLLADLKWDNPTRYYEILFDNVQGVHKQEVDWDAFKKMENINE